METGPYKLKLFEPGIRARFERNSNWHQEGAYFDEVELIGISDPQVLVNALITGDVDAITKLTPQQAQQLRGRYPDIIVESVTSGSAITMPMFVDVAPFDNQEVRQAMKYAINREQLIDIVYKGMATIGNDFHLSQAMPYWPGEIPQREYDPDKASYLLKQAGLDRLEVDLSSSIAVDQNAVEIARVYADQARVSGIKINVIREPSDGYWSSVWQQKPFVMSSWQAYQTPDDLFTQAYQTNAHWNESHWSNDRFDQLLIQARAELDELKKSELYKEMCEIMRDDGGTIIPLFPNQNFATSKKINTNGTIANNLEMDGARACHRWWFDD